MESLPFLKMVNLTKCHVIQFIGGAISNKRPMKHNSEKDNDNFYIMLSRYTNNSTFYIRVNMTRSSSNILWKLAKRPRFRRKKRFMPPPKKKNLPFFQFPLFLRFFRMSFLHLHSFAVWCAPWSPLCTPLYTPLN